MAVIGITNPTLSDVAKRLDPDGAVDKIVEILNETNEVLDDAVFMEGNLPTGHVYTTRTGLPDVAWRILNYGVQPSKSRTAQVTDTCGMLEAYAEVDKELADLNGNTEAFRLSESRAFMESMSQTMSSALFYGNQLTDPEKITGFAPRFNDLSAPNADNIIDAGGTGTDNTSIWLIGWGENTVFGMYPKGSKAGLTFKDLGEETLTDAAGGLYQGYRAHFQWKAGLCVKDWRYIVRIPNIDKSALTKDASAGADLIDLLVQAMEIPPNLTGARFAFYGNKLVRGFLRRQITNKTNVDLSMDEVYGKKVLTVDGIPFRRCDALEPDEARVV